MASENRSAHRDPSATPAMLPAVQPAAPILQPPPIRSSSRRRQEPDLNPGFAIAVWTRWWKLLLPTMLCLSIASSGVVFLLAKPSYRSSAFISVRHSRDWILTPSRDESRSFVRTQIEFIRSPVVLGRAISDPEVAELDCIKDNLGAVDWLARKLEIVSKDDVEFFEVALQSPDSESATRMVNAVVSAYLKLNEEKELQANERLLLKLEDQREEKQEIVAQRKTRLEKLLGHMLEVDATAPTPGDERMILSDDPLGELQDELSENELQISLLKARLTAKQETDLENYTVKRVVILQQVNSDPRMQSLEVLLDQKLQNLVRYQSTSRGGTRSFGYQRLAREAEDLKQKIKQTRTRLEAEWSDRLAIMAQAEKQDTLDSMMQELDQLNVKRNFLKQQLTARQKLTKSTSEQATAVEMAQRDFEIARDVLARINGRITEVQTESAAESRVALMKAAEVPTNPVPSGLWKHLLVSLAASIFVPLGIALVWERSACRIVSSHQIEDQVDVPVIGEVARLPARATGRDGRLKNSGNRDIVLFEESIDSIRTNLLLQPDLESLQVLAVCSSVASEGKTSVTSQLAVSLARATSRPTLLIDGDMRSPDIHSVFNIDLDPGLVEVLDGQVDLDDAINRDWSDHVHLLPAGTINKNPHKLLGRGQFAQLLDAARLNYRYIVVDTPPVLAASESLVMARATDGVIICTMHEHSRGDHVRLTYERLVSAGAKPLGAVLNGVSTRSYAYKYGNYSYGGEGRYRYSYNRY